MSNGRSCFIRDLGPVKGGKGLKHHEVVLELSWRGLVRFAASTLRFPVERDRLGRLPVDACLKIKGMQAEFAAGDVAWLPIDNSHASVMSCQHARPMGRFAGYKVRRLIRGLRLLLR
jgi:NADH:ubiquinone reductase (H+-translocating)